MSKVTLCFVLCVFVTAVFVGCEAPGPAGVEAPRSKIEAFSPTAPEEPAAKLNLPEPNIAKPRQLVAVEPSRLAQPDLSESAAGEPNRPGRLTESSTLPEPGSADLEPAEANALTSRVEESLAREQNAPQAAPAEPNLESYEAAGPGSMDAFCNKFADIFSNYVRKDGSVDYDQLRRRKAKAKELLEQFYDLEPAIYRSWSVKDRTAFWINIYNTALVKIIIDNYPIQSTTWGRILWGPYSIRNIEGNIEGIWNDNKFIVMNEEFTLREIERRFFEEEFNEPRAFLALSRASRSGPPLRDEPYCGGRLDEQLDEQVGRFLSDPQAFRIDRETKIVYLSSLLQPTVFGRQFTGMYGTDKKFKDHDAVTRAILNFVADYLPAADVEFLETGSYTVKYLNYDWTINN